MRRWIAQVVRAGDRRARVLAVALACAVAGSATASLASAVDTGPGTPRAAAAPPALLPAPDPPEPVVLPPSLGPIGPPAPDVAVPTRAKAEPRKRPSQDYYRRTAARRVPLATSRGFVPLYQEAAETFGVDWRLIASVHKQETAFSTVPSTYRGRNAYGCCAGPMQFNVTNGPVSTWELYRDAYKQGQRPKAYPHPTRSHPSIYDDFDAIMAAAMLLRDGGATEELGSGSWSAAYAYYGRDLFGITYASQVLGRARGWAQEGFCTDCPDDPKRVAALDDAYGVAARQELLAAEAEGRQAKAKRAKAKATAKARRERRLEAARAREAARRAAPDGEDGAGDQRRPDPPAEETPAAPEPTPPARPARPATTSTAQSAPPPTAAPPPATTTGQAPPPAPPPEGGGECTPLAGVLGCP